MKEDRVHASLKRADESSAKSKGRSRPLSQWLSDEPGSPGDLVPLMVNVIQAVVRVQQAEPRHCNLDPREIVVREDGSVHVAVRPSSDAGKTVAARSLKYTSPELLDENAAAQAVLSNSYVLGLVFYELLLGRAMFDEQFRQVNTGGNMAWLAWHASRNAAAPALIQLLPGFPSIVSKVIEGMMAKDPGKRYSDLAAIARLLERTSEPTSMHKVVRSSAHVNGGSSVHADNAPRSWLIALSEQGFWKQMWRRVDPANPRIARASVDELERMLRQAEGAVKRIGEWIGARRS